MINNVRTLSLDPSDLSIPDCDILLYSGCRNCEDEKILSLCRECISELKSQITLRAVFAEVHVTFNGDTADFTFGKYTSRSLRKFLGGDCNACIFAATIGIGADRLISKYSPIIPSKAVIMDGCATAAVECWCDYICDKIFSVPAQERFSPGYGDLPLHMQRDILRALDADLKIGLTMTDSMMLTPTKSVTAIAKKD